MSLDLDKRQRAMLREMGVRVWQPMSHAPAVSPTLPSAHISPPPVRSVETTEIAGATVLIATTERNKTATSTFDQKNTPVQRAPEAVAAAPATASPPRVASDEALWSVGQALALYADTVSSAGPRWLVLAETPAAALQGGSFNPFEGDAGKLLDNMLRAARLHLAGTVLFAPLARRSGGDAAAAALSQALPSLVAGARPDIVLVMGRLAAMALLQTNEAFGKLRGQVHMIQGVKTVVTQDATVLLRQPADKAKAWEDLCLAMSLAQAMSD